MKSQYWNKYQEINNYLFTNYHIASKNEEYIDKHNSTYQGHIRFWNKNNPQDKTELNFETELENNNFIDALYNKLKDIHSVQQIESVFNKILGELYLD